MTGEIEVADGIQRLVADELVVVAQAFLVEDAVAIDHDRVVEAAAAGQTRFTQRGDVRQQAEGAGTADLGLERLPVDPERTGLTADRGGAEVDVEIDLQALGPRAQRDR